MFVVGSRTSFLLLTCSLITTVATAAVVLGACVDRTNPDTSPDSSNPDYLTQASSENGAIHLHPCSTGIPPLA